jgi:hypothetical protein
MKEIFLLSVVVFGCCHSLTYIVVAVSRINIPWPFGHSNILYLRTCTILFNTGFWSSLDRKPRVLCWLCLSGSDACSRVDPRRHSIFCGKLFASCPFVFVSVMDVERHSANNLSCLEKSLPELGRPESCFLSPIPCFRHNLLTKAEIRSP